MKTLTDPAARALRVQARLLAASTVTAPRPERRGRGHQAVPHIVVRNAFHGADHNRLLMDWVVSCLPADEDIKRSMLRLRARARELERNNPTARRYLRLYGTNVIGAKGIGLRARVRLASGDLDKTTNGKIETAWKRWSRSRVTVDRRLTWPQLQRLAARTVKRDGEIFFRKFVGFPNAFGFALQPIDADLIDHTLNRDRGPYGNEIRMGIEVDELGAPVAYHVSERPRSGYATPGPTYRVPAEEMIHLYDPEFFNQTRGITVFAPVMWALHMLQGYTESELVAARTAAAKMGFIEQKPDAIAGEMDPEAVPPVDAADPNAQAAVPEQLERLDGSPGAIEMLPIGATFNAWDPQHPTSAFGDFVKSNKRDAASGLNVGYNALSNDAESVNYSSLRSFFLLDRDAWQEEQQRMTDDMVVPVYESWLGPALLSGALKLGSRDPKNYLDVEGVPRGWPWVDPLKDIQAGVLAVDNGLGTRKQFLGELGLDVEEVFEQLAEEEKLAAEYGIVLGGAATKAAQASIAANPDTPQETSPSTNGNGKEPNRLVHIAH